MLCGLLLLGLLVGCSEDNKEESAVEEKGIVETTTDKAADTAVEHIQKPIDDARAVQAVQNAQTANMKELVDEEGGQQ